MCVVSTAAHRELQTSQRGTAASPPNTAIRSRLGIVVKRGSHLREVEAWDRGQAGIPPEGGGGLGSWSSGLRANARGTQAAWGVR